MLPAFSLKGTIGYSSNNIGEKFALRDLNWQNALVQSAASFTMPVFNYGRLINKVRVQDASFREAVLNYQNTVLTAQKEVENGLSAFKYGKQSVVYLEQAVSAAKMSTKLAIDRYKAGQSDFTTVLSALQQQLNVENSLVGRAGRRRARPRARLPLARRRLGTPRRPRRDFAGSEGGNGQGEILGRTLEPARHIPATPPEDQPVEVSKKRRGSGTC